MDISRALLSFCLALVVTGCSLDGTRNRFLLAERLFEDQRYSSSVEEFLQVTRRDPKGKLGLQALYRAAQIEMMYLRRYRPAVQKLKAFVASTKSRELKWTARKQMAQIHFLNSKAYDKAERLYVELAAQKVPKFLKDRSDPRPLFLFRAARAQFFQAKFDDAVKTYQQLARDYANSPYAEKARFQEALTHYTRGEQKPDARSSAAQPYRLAIKAYRKFVEDFPKSRLAVRAKYGVAASLEELDRLAEARTHYLAILDEYPTPEAIQIKLQRIGERVQRRNR